MPREIPQIFITQRADWWRAYVIWQTLHYTVGAIAIICGTLAAVLTQYAVVFGVTAAVSSTLITFANPSRKASAYSKAHRRLLLAKTRFLADDSYEIAYVVEAMGEGEKIIEGAEE